MERSKIIREIVEQKKEDIKQSGIVEKINHLFFSRHIPLPFLEISELELETELWNKEVKQLIESEIGKKLLIKSVVKSDGILLHKNSNTYTKLCVELDYCKFEFLKLQYFDSNNWSPWKYEFFIIFHNGIKVCSFNGKKSNQFSHPSSTEVFEPKSFLSFSWLHDFEMLISFVDKYEKEEKLQKRKRLDRKDAEAAEDLRLSFSISENEIGKFNNQEKKSQPYASKLIQVFKKIILLFNIKF